MAPPTQPAENWATLTDAKRHFHLDYPPSWKANRVLEVVAHYSMVLAALNSAGKEGFTVKEVQIKPGTWELNADLIAQQVPMGTGYVDIEWQEGPGPMRQLGPGVVEMEAADVSALWKSSTETRSGELIERAINFQKWGKAWNIVVYMHAPAPAALRADVEKILASFRFDGVPAGDEAWALGVAHKRLPPEADPDRYTRQGGSSEYFCTAKANGDEVFVTFTKHLGDTPAKSWNYRVTAKGEVTAVESN